MKKKIVNISLDAETKSWRSQFRRYISKISVNLFPSLDCAPERKTFLEECDSILHHKKGRRSSLIDDLKELRKMEKRAVREFGEIDIVTEKVLAVCSENVGLSLRLFTLSLFFRLIVMVIMWCQYVIITIIIIIHFIIIIAIKLILIQTLRRLGVVLGEVLLCLRLELARRQRRQCVRHLIGFLWVVECGVLKAIFRWFALLCGVCWRVVFVFWLQCISVV